MLGLRRAPRARELAATTSGAPSARARASCSACARCARRARDDVARLPEPLRRRARHVLERERARARSRAARCARATCRRSGALLDASHASLRDLYEVSTPAVEATVERLRTPGAAGARMIGGGFGGCVLGLFAPGTRPPAERVEVRPGPGAHLLARRRRLSVDARRLSRARRRSRAVTAARDEQRGRESRRSPATAPRARRRAAPAARASDSGSVLPVAQRAHARDRARAPAQLARRRAERGAARRSSPGSRRRSARPAASIRSA